MTNSQLTTHNTQLPKGYKQTEVGMVPEDWKVIPLAEFSSVMHGYGFQSQYFSSHGIYRLTTPGHFHESGGFRDVGDKQKFYNGPFPEGYILNKGDLIVAMTEQADGLLGSAALIPLEGIYLHNQRLGKIKLLSPNVSIKFLYWVFNSKGYRAKVRETAAGTKVKHTSPSKLLEILIAAPPSFVEQDAIAEALGDVDALITALEQLIAKKRHIKQGTMQELLTGQTRLPGFTGAWETKTLGEIGESLIGLTYRPSDVKSDGLLVLRSSNVFEGTLRFDDNVFVDVDVPERIILKKGDILICVRNGSRDLIGKCALINERAQGMTFGAFMAVFRTPFHDFVYHQFQSDKMKRQIREHLGATINQITNKSLNSFQIPFPKNEAEQTAIATILSDMDAEITALETKLQKTRHLKQGMMQELLTGRIRLI